MKKIQPYNDDLLTFNEKTQQYELNIGLVKGEIGNPYTDDGVLELRIKKNTRQVYDYIFDRAYSGNRKVILAIINHTQEYREWIYDALFRQMEADISSGFNSNGEYTSDNQEQRLMKQLDRVCVNAQSVLDNSMGYGGINLLFSGVFPYSVYLNFMEFCK